MEKKKEGELGKICKASAGVVTGSFAALSSQLGIGHLVSRLWRVNLRVSLLVSSFQR